MRGGYIRKLRLFRRLIVFNCCYFVFFIFQNSISIKEFFNCAWKKNFSQGGRAQSMFNFNILVYFHFNLPSLMFSFFLAKLIFSLGLACFCSELAPRRKRLKTFCRVCTLVIFSDALYLGETSAGLMDIDFWKFSLCFCFHLYLKWFTTHLFITNISYRHWQSSPRATKLPQN